MLALAYAAVHPERVTSLALVGCATFDPAARGEIQAIREQRMDAGLRQRIEGLAEEFPDPDKRLAMMAHLLLPVDSHELLSTGREVLTCDARAHHETWDDMVRLQDASIYPAAFAKIDAPVLMLHGAADPHPGSMIRSSLKPHLPQLEYRELQRCGHYPWLEKGARDEFFAMLREWLGRQP
jgi:pimeloyl-ACP methyl ester carboxylesterase